MGLATALDQRDRFPGRRSAGRGAVSCAVGGLGHPVLHSPERRVGGIQWHGLSLPEFGIGFSRQPQRIRADIRGRWGCRWRCRCPVLIDTGRCSGDGDGILRSGGLDGGGLDDGGMRNGCCNRKRRLFRQGWRRLFRPGRALAGRRGTPQTGRHEHDQTRFPDPCFLDGRRCTLPLVEQQQDGVYRDDRPMDGQSPAARP